MSSDNSLTGSTENPPSLTIYGTPHSQGSSGHYTHQPQHRRHHYNPYPKEDLKHNCPISFDEFLNEALHLAPDWMQQHRSKISRIVNAKSLFDNVYAYCQPVSQKTHRNHPFTAHLVRATLIENGDDADEALNWQVIVKLSWPSISRMSEQIAIEQGREKTDDDEHCWALMHSPPKVCHTCQPK
jgi:hypothetical protein